MDIFLWLFLFLPTFNWKFVNFQPDNARKLWKLSYSYKNLCNHPDTTNHNQPTAWALNILNHFQKDHIPLENVVCHKVNLSFYLFNLNSSLLFPQEQFLNQETNNYRGVGHHSWFPQWKFLTKLNWRLFCSHQSLAISYLDWKTLAKIQLCVVYFRMNYLLSILWEKILNLQYL